MISELHHFRSAIPPDGDVMTDGECGPCSMHVFDFAGRKGLCIQVVALVACGLLVAIWHWSNDGLWFQGDAPRHAMNGVFYRDLIAEGLYDPLEYAQRYYARYPAITPTRYPPLFYLVEAVAFQCFGISTSVAKGVVWLFGLMAGIYLIVAIRRWISPDVGLAAALLVLMPGMVRWSNAVMLNVPAMAVGLAALFHVRCGLERVERLIAVKHVCIGMVLATLSMMIHPTIGYVVVIGLAWIVLSERRSLLLDRRTAAVGLGCVVLLGALFGVMKHLSPEQFSQANVELERLSRWRTLGFYVRSLPSLVDFWGVPLMLAGAAWICFQKTSRADAWRLAVAAAVAYAALTVIWAKDERYLMLACPLATWLIAYLLFGLTATVNDCWGRRGARVALMCAWGLLIAYYMVVALGQSLPNVAAMEQVVQELVALAPREPVLYDGRYDGTFVYYLRARDPKFQRQIVLARKLDESSGKLNRPIDSAQLTDLMCRSGCRWLVLEKPITSQEKPIETALQTAVQNPAFELVKSFKLMPRLMESIDIYRIRSEDPNLDNSGSVAIPIRVNGQRRQPVEHQASSHEIE